jgi:Tfp pilus assembly protein PilN
LIKINLLAAPGRVAPARELFPAAHRSALVAMSMLVMTAAGIGGWWFYQRTQATRLEGRLAAAETEIERLKDATKAVAMTNARKAELSERLALIDRLREAKRGPVNLLETLNRSIPDNLWLLEVRQGGAAVHVDGRALSLSSVTDFAQHLQNSGLFRHPVEILTTSTEVIDETSVVRFSVKADAVKPAGPVTAAATAAAPVLATPGAKGV